MRRKKTIEFYTRVVNSAIKDKALMEDREGDGDFILLAPQERFHRASNHPSFSAGATM